MLPLASALHAVHHVYHHYIVLMIIMQQVYGITGNILFVLPTLSVLLIALIRDEPLNLQRPVAMKHLDSCRAHDEFLTGD